MSQTVVFQGASIQSCFLNSFKWKGIFQTQFKVKHLFSNKLLVRHLFWTVTNQTVVLWTVVVKTDVFEQFIPPDFVNLNTRELIINYVLFVNHFKIVLHPSYTLAIFMIQCFVFDVYCNFSQSNTDDRRVWKVTFYWTETTTIILYFYFEKKIAILFDEILTKDNIWHLEISFTLKLK